MKKSVQTRGTLENLLFPQRVKPYRDITQISMDPSALKASTSRKLHLLEVTEPHHILQRIFQPYLYLVKFLGCLPVKIQDGSASFSYLSWGAAYSFFVFSIFLTDTFFYVPIMYEMSLKSMDNTLLFYVESVLVVSQVLAVLASYTFATVMGNRMVIFWNHFQGVLVRVVARCPNHLGLVRAYRGARMKIVVWLMYTVVYGVCYITSFQEQIRNFLTDRGYNMVSYWVIFFGFTTYSGMLSFHILHTTSFTTFGCVMNSCFETLGNIALKQDGQGTLRNARSPVLFEEVLQIYDELLQLKTQLGGIYGLYLAFEFFAMVVCSTINLFFLISQWDNVNLVVLNLAIVIPYVVWFHGICSCAGHINSGMRKCYKKIRRAIASAIKLQSVPGTEIAYLQVEPPECLSAAGYFRIDLNLFTSVLGTIATYLVVMLQFGSGMKANSLHPNNSTNT